MKYCTKCKKGFNTEEENCPVCGKKLLDRGNNKEDGFDEGEFVAVMTAIGLF
ncbi:MAG: hypothetical protein PHX26_10115 [Proteiniphilum sp.]|nr:hypothetical protein [Proteiniphilum sp.]